MRVVLGTLSLVLLLGFALPAQAPMWEPILQIVNSSPIHGALGSFGTATYFQTADLRMYTNRALNQAAPVPANWMGPLSTTTTDVGYLEKPVAATATYVLQAAVEATQTITDFLGPRKVGDVFVWRTVDQGQTYTRIRVTTNRKAYRLSIDAYLDTAILTYMTWVGPTSPGTWNIETVRSIDGGQTWEPPQVRAFGTNPVGAERPTLAIAGLQVGLSWMDARNAPGPCVVEGGAVLPFCTQVFFASSADGGATYNPGVSLTPDAAYSGRPAMARDGAQILILFDRHEQVSGATNEIGSLRSSDNGDTFTQGLAVAAANDQTHGTAAWNAARGLGACWMDRRVVSTEIRCAFSTDAGASWQDEFVVSGGGDSAAPTVAWTLDTFQVMWPRVKQPMQYRRKVWTTPPVTTCTTTPLTLDWGTVSPLAVVTLTDNRGCVSQRP